MSSRRRSGSDNSALTKGILTTVGVGVAVVSYVPGFSAWLFAKGDQTGTTCIVQRMTGWRCPFCGMTHGTVDLLHGHVGSALEHNVFSPVFVLGLGVMLAGTFSARVSHRVDAMTARIGQARLGSGVIVAMLTYSVMRNLGIVTG